MLSAQLPAGSGKRHEHRPGLRSEFRRLDGMVTAAQGDHHCGRRCRLVNVSIHPEQPGELRPPPPPGQRKPLPLTAVVSCADTLIEARLPVIRAGVSAARRRPLRQGPCSVEMSPACKHCDSDDAPDGRTVRVGWPAARQRRQMGREPVANHERVYGCAAGGLTDTLTQCVSSPLVAVGQD